MQQLNTALCSFGFSSTIFHFPFLVVNPRFKITKVLERNKQNSKSKLPDAQIVRAYDEILNDPDIDLVIVNTPNELHFEMAKQALINDKHVLVEKPFTTSFAEAEELIKLAKVKKKILTVYHNRRLDSDFKTVQKLLSQNLLGDIKLFDSQIFRWKPEIGNKLWKTGAYKGAGLLFDLGSHLIDQALILFGLPKSLFADLRVLRKNTVADDYFELILDYEYLKVALKASLLSNNPGYRFVIQGESACFTKFGNDPQEELLMKGIFPNTDNWGVEDVNFYGTISSESGVYKYESCTGAYQDFFTNLYLAIVHQEELIVKPEEARDVIRIIELAFMSNREKKVIELNSLI